MLAFNMFGVVAVDVNTTTGKNLHAVQSGTGLDPLITSLVKLKAGNRIIILLSYLRQGGCILWGREHTLADCFGGLY